MVLPVFAPGDDPGPSFSNLLRHLDSRAVAPGGRGARSDAAGLAGSGLAGSGLAGSGSFSGPGALFPADQQVALRHGTTVLAFKFADGVVMAGDRRATEGNLIAHRGMEKVFPADRHSAVAIAGVAGPAVEMVRLFQTQLEHYEKVEGIALSLEGKANQLGQMVREHLPMAMQGLVVVPLFAGYDLARSEGRIFTYDVTGGHYEETELAATGSGGRDARLAVKFGWRPGLSGDEAVELAVRALYEAADEDSATGGPDAVRGIYPLVSLVGPAGFELVDESVVADCFARLVASKQVGGQQGVGRT